MKDVFVNRIIVCTITTVPVLLLTFLVQTGYWLDGKFIFHGNVYIVFMLTCVVYFYGGFPFLKELFSRSEKNLVALLATAAFLYSVLVLFGAIQSTIVLFWEVDVFIDIMLLVFWIDANKRRKTAEASLGKEKFGNA